MEDRSSLLNQLRIDRADTAAEPRGRRGRWWAAGAVSIAASAAAVWLLAAPTGAVVVGVATAEPLAAVEGTAARGSMLDASGYVVARRQATVSSKVTGKVVEVLIEEGQSVEAGEVVARLDDSNARAQAALAAAQLDEAIARANAAKVAFENAGAIFERNREQYASAIISAQDFDTAEAAYDSARTGLEVARQAVNVAEAGLALARRNLDDTVVRAPFAGVVTVKAAQEGEMVSPVSGGGGFTRTGIGTIVDMNSLEVEVDVSENFINRVRPGQDVMVRLNAYPDWAIAGRVIAIIPTADRAKATVTVRIGLGEKDERILPEMGVRVSFLGEAPETTGTAAIATAAVLVPAAAIETNGDTGFVYLIRDDRVERRAVRLGARSSDKQVVLAGLSAGTRLAVADFSKLEDGARVRVELRP